MVAITLYFLVLNFFLFLQHSQLLCDPEPDSDEHNSIFFTQRSKHVAETQLDDEEDDHSLLSPPDDHTSDIELNQAQKNLLSDLVKHRLQVLNHSDRATQFRLLADNGTSLPKYTKPTITLHDQQFFSSTIQSKLDAITIDFQKHLCALLQEHHEEMRDHSKLMYKLRMDTINRLYKNPALTRRLSRLSEDESTELYTSGLIRHRRNPRLGDKRPLS